VAAELGLVVAYRASTTSDWPTAITHAVPFTSVYGGGAPRVSPTNAGSAPRAVYRGATVGDIVGVYTGRPVHTHWGPVQVRITVGNHRIMDVDAIQYPFGHSRGQEINIYAVPALNREVLAAQSAHIDAISGATDTSAGYVNSLQSALDLTHVQPAN